MYNLVGRILEKSMGRQVEMHKWPQSQYFDEVLS